MWQRWLRFGPIGWAFVALFGFGVFQFVKDWNEPKGVEVASAEQPVLPPSEFDEVPQFEPSSSTYDENPTAPSIPPTATVDGLTYTGEQQIEALTQAARDAGLDEAAAQRTGREAAIICNGNPDCLR